MSSMLYECEETRIEPGTQIGTQIGNLEARAVVARVMTQFGTVLNTNSSVDELRVSDEGVILSLHYTEHYGRGGEDTFFHDALLSWNMLLNGDLSEWVDEVTAAHVQKRRDQAVREQQERHEQAMRNAADAARLQRERDVDAYNRIKAELEANPDTNLDTEGKN